MFEAIKHYRIEPGKDLNTEIERVKKEMERDGITINREKLTEKDRETMREIVREMGYKEID